MAQWYRRDTHGAGGKFIRRPCAHCNTWGHNTSTTCPTPDAVERRRVARARRRAVRKLTQEAK